MNRAALPDADERLIRAPANYTSLTNDILAPVLQRGLNRRWLFAFGLAGALTLVLLTGITWLLIRGVGVWGVNIPVAWGFAIVNFVWWIGIGHAGTLISAILFLLRQEWRNSINRFAEAMTLFAVANAGLFPLLHLGRIWRFYYLFPYPDTMRLWPQWRSPLVWDVVAVLTYATVSLLFWYVGLLPDLAAVRSAARTRWGARLAGLFALGWRGDGRHWQRHQMLYLLMAGLATPLVVSVHSIVSLDFAVSIVPGWHTTIFPPYFVAGAIYSGFAMVITIAVPLRTVYGFQHLITPRHFDAMGKVMLTAGLVLLYGYAFEIFTAFFSPDRYEHFMMFNRAAGPYAVAFWVTLVCNFGIGQLLWLRRVRTNLVVFFVISLLINLGMWLERFVIVVVSLHRDYLPSAWDVYWPTLWDWTVLIGSLGFFTLLMLLFARFIPALSIYELRETLTREQPPAPVPPAAVQAEVAIEIPAHDDPAVYGVAAEFATPQQFLDAATAVRRLGLTQVETFTPMPVHGLRHALQWPATRLAAAVLIGGFASAAGAYFLQWYAAVVSYPIQVGGRPLHSWPSFIPLTFELGVLGGTLAGLATLIGRCRLPKLYHPMFEMDGFERAAHDRFILCVRSAGGGSPPDELVETLRTHGALHTQVVRRRDG